MSAARPTIDISGRRIAIDLPHLAFATAIAGWCAWFFRDAWLSAADVENLILIAPAATAAIILYGFVAAGCFQFIAGNAEPAPLRPPLAASIAIKIAGSMALLGAFVVAGPLVGFDIASFVYLLAMMLFLGERRILVLLLVPLLFCIAAIYCFNAILSTPLPLFFFSGGRLMIDMAALASAAHLLASSWQPWMVVIPGILIGLIVHSVPGLTTSMALAICLPLIPYMDFLQALIFMTAMYAGALFGVAIPAILLNVPGSASAVGTTFDGFPMAQAGKHNEALGLALAASCIGQAVAYLLLLCLAGPIAAFAIKLGPPEMLMVSLWGITLIARLRGRHFARGLMAGAFGLLLGTVGLSARGAPRGTFDIDLLLDGIPVVPAIVGLFAAAELFNLVGRDYIVDDLTRRRVDAGRILAGMRETLRHPGVLLRGAILGSGIGILPGGHAIANLLSYSEARRAARDPEKFGTGDPRGIIAAESANASSEGGSMATLLALGIPTGGATAVMLVAFSMHNITGGPAFMRDHADIVYAVILSSLAQVFILGIVGFAFIFVAGFVVKVRLRMLVPMVLAMAVIGSFALAQNLAGPVTLALFAVIGWLMQRFDYPVAATVIGLLLGRLTEGALLRTYQMSGGDMGFLLTRPIALTILFLLIVSIMLPYLRSAYARVMGNPAGKDMANET